MQFISIYFLLFMLAAIVGYYCMPQRWSYLFVLVCNILYYATWISDPTDFMVLIMVIVMTWWGARLLYGAREGKKRKILLFCIVLLTVGGLAFFKYTNFLLANIVPLLRAGTISFVPGKINLMMPIGISFFTFQALGYVIDVYRGREVEQNFLLYASYVSFFVTITSGPIERADGLMTQLKQGKKGNFSIKNLEGGVLLVLWGAAVKYVISDRMAVLVNTVYADYRGYGGAILLLISIVYTFQIYCDFSSYSLIALGLGKILGIKVTENFDAPYLSSTIQEFWRRWHISLSTWFRDYVYISLGGNRCTAIRKNLNLMLTFLISGIWHGANWTFVVWGGIHGIYQIFGNITRSIRKSIYEKWDVNTQCASFRIGQKMTTFLLISFAWIFFRAATLSEAAGYISRIFTDFRIWELFNSRLYSLGLNQLQMDILGVSFLFFLIVDYIKYKTGRSLDEWMIKQNLVFRGGVMILLFLATFVFGMYGPAFNAQEFIYFQF